MASEFSFDVVSKIDLQAVEDAVNTAMKEMLTRFDFKGSVSSISLDKKTGTLALVSDDENKLKSVIDVLHGRLIKRGLSLKNFEFGKVEPTEKGAVKESVKICQGVFGDKARAVVAAIKGSGRKATSSIQGDQIRVVSRSKDDLQAIIALLKSQDFGLDLQFTNYR